MTQEQCLAFLQALHAKKIRVKGNGWIEACCPLAPWLHAHHTDSTPSFGISITPEGSSHFQCFACRSGSVEELLQVLELYTQGKPHTFDFKTCHELLEAMPLVMPLPPYGEFTIPTQVFHEWPSYWLESFVPVESATMAYQYLLYRRVSPVIMQQFNLRYDSKRQMIVAPYSDVFGRLAGARGRSVVAQATGFKKHYDYTWHGANNARLCWYNEGVLNLPGPVVVVEGQFDLWRVVPVFPKTVAALTAKPTLEKMKKLADCPTVIQIPDNDEAGHESIKLYAKYCNQLQMTHRVLKLDPGAKDPDECHPDYLRDRIESLLVTG